MANAQVRKAALNNLELTYCNTRTNIKAASYSQEAAEVVDKRILVFSKE